MLLSEFLLCADTSVFSSFIELSEAGRFATAWAIVKALLPLRLILSVWAAPWFARIAVVPCFNLAKKVSGFRGKAAVASSSATAGIGAVSGRNVAHEAPGTIGPVKSAATVGNEMERGVKDPP